jgi:AcrR family transcriptional regulator
MRVRDPDGKKRQLIDAAMTEFASHGLAGSRIDAIAERAGCSAGLVYTYFGNKEALFDAVLADLAATTGATVPIDGDDLPGYAERLHAAGRDHPEVVRFVTWYQLERDAGADPGPGTEETVRHKIDVIRQAQGRGLVRDDIPAPMLLLSLQAIARMWVTEPQSVLAIIDPDTSDAFRREAVRLAVSALITPPGNATPGPA